MRNTRPIIHYSDEKHICSSCGTEFQGRYCPQCGMDSQRGKISIHRKISERFFFRTLRDLFWRPGYMVADYLDGRRSLYFPPVKLLIVVGLFVTVILQLLKHLGCHIDEHSIWNDLSEIFSVDDTLFLKWIGDAVNKTASYMKDHYAYDLIVRSLLGVFTLWLVLKMGSRRFARNFSLAEVFTAEMYFISQIQLVSIVYICFAAAISPDSTFSISLPFLLSFFLYFFDYWQLYQRGVWGTIWRMFLAMILKWVLFCALVFLFLFLSFFIGSVFFV